MKKETQEKIVSLRILWGVLGIVFTLSFLVFGILGIAKVMSPSIASMISTLSLTLLSLVSGISQLPLNPKAGKVYFFTAGLLFLCSAVFLILKLTKLMP